MKKDFKTPRKWKKYERAAVRVVLDWVKMAQYEDKEWDDHIHLFAASVYNNGDGLVFLYFDEKRQRVGMRTEYKDWMRRILDNISRLPFY